MLLFLITTNTKKLDIEQTEFLLLKKQIKKNLLLKK